MGFNNGEELQEGKAIKELHMFYLLDTSGSMSGEGIAQLNSGMRETIRILKDKFEASGDARLRISVMTFNTVAAWVTGTPASKHSEYIEDFIDFPEQSAQGLTHLGDALNMLRAGLSRNEMLESPTGNKRPIIIIMSDGAPNDDWQSALRKIQENRWFQQAIKIGIALGSNANEGVLAEVVGDREGVLRITDMSTFANLLVAVSVTSSLAGSRSVVSEEESGSGAEVVQRVASDAGQKKPAPPTPPTPMDPPEPQPPTPAPAPVDDPLFDVSDVE